MRVAEIWRYPIKSVGGEKLDQATVTPVGIRHDRGWGLVDDTTGNVLTARREPRLLMGSARVVDHQPLVTTDEEQQLRTSADFSDWLRRPVTLTSADGRPGGTYEVPLDFERDADWISWQGPPDAWHDSDKSRVSLVSTASLGAWDFRRFRANILLDGAGEGDLVGRAVELGSAVLSVTKPIDRCVIVTRPQPGLTRDLDVLRTIIADHESHLCVGARVRTPGTIAVGDRVVES
jgi:MOSC domain-containing protein